ncbi:uncharacterized protein [Typha latifolia]|uniref:uncharacterized protein isoform X2 n=1 Tax=Typha latifolia TaxID=4733 RepID=UPI003C30DF8D
MAFSPSSTLEGALLLLVAVLLPLRLLSIGIDLIGSPDRRRSGTVRSVVVLVSVAALLSAIYALSDLETSSLKDAAISQVEESNRIMKSEVEELKLKITRLEHILEESTRTLNSREAQLEEDNKLIEAMEHDIQALIYEQDKVKVQLLKDESRKMNSNIYILESLANDSEKRLEALSSEVKKIENVVAEQWIQVRQFEQAFQLTKMMASKVRRRSMHRDGKYHIWPSKYMMSKVRQFLKCINLQHMTEVALPDSFFLGGSVSQSFISQAYSQSERIMSGAQTYHYKVKEFVKYMMGLNKYTAPFADTVIGFSGHAILIFLIWMAWISCLAWFWPAKEIIHVLESCQVYFCFCLCFCLFLLYFYFF